MALLCCKDLILGYEGRAVLRNVSFEVHAGDYLCIVGENGSGKSTLMKTVLGLNRPLGGSIVFGDGLSPAEIGYLPQQTAAQKGFPATVREIVLSGLSGTVVYSQVYNILYDPQPWLGKTIRIAGYYSDFQDPLTGVVYHACVIPDATACCAQGFEFVRKGECRWPEDYPEGGTDIVVTGRLEMYVEDGISYLHLTDADMLWDKEAE